METTLKDVLEFIHSKATTREVDQIFKACNDRVNVLRSIEGSINMSLLKSGDTVELHGLKPKYINGMRGTVKGTSPRREASFEITLSEADSAMWRMKKRHWGEGPVTVGIPASCLTKVDTDA